MDRYIGRMLDNRYEILEVIGSGGMAVVYKARCHRLNRLVAIKILKDENLQDEDFRRRFHAESQAVAMLSHPNIVSVYDVSMDSDEDYIVMELIEGISLKQYMEKKGVLNWKETLHFAIQIAKALDHAHSKGLVHRDIKPHNVMVLKTGAVKVADFGIARMMSKSNTLTKEALGSVHYISPEQARGGRVDNRSDIYSLGVVMYEMITGRPPFDGESPVSVAIQHINGGAENPSDLNPNIPEALEQIILKAMAKDPAQRYTDAAAMLHDMDEFRKNPAIVLLPSGVAAATSAVEEDAPAQKEEVPMEKKTAPKPVNPPTPRRKPTAKDYEMRERRRSTIITTAVVILALLFMLSICVGAYVVIANLMPELAFWNPTQSQSATVSVPGLVGMYYSRLPEYDGVEIVVQDRVYSSQYGEGQIVRQEPQEGEIKEYGSKVYIFISLGPRPADAKVKMINLAGRTVESARNWLDDQGLNLSIKLVEEHSSTIPAGCVISTNPADGETLSQNDKITLVVSLGKETAVMPELVGASLSVAQSRMSRTKFTNVQWVPVNSLLPSGTVISQSIAANTVAAVDTRIVVTYSNGVLPDSDIVTLDVTIDNLPESSEGYYLSVVANGEAILLDVWVNPGQTSCTVQLSGYGLTVCEVFVNGAYHSTMNVDFVADE